ncbi:S-methyl-5-thioribose kinase [Profundibacter sp.]|uniref:S-methyl-5-thioribose kinase n=1 Tax=Profundibacter sp. TaxID=3101071 RepID=UPI003D0A5F55
MSEQSSGYEPLTVETIPARLGGISAVTERLGEDTSAWVADEVGDGNLNLVFIVKSPKGAVIVKQALPYVRLVGDSWPLPLKRAFFEYHALIRQEERAPGLVPEIYHFDEDQALIVMEFLTPHIILRHSLMAGKKHDGLAAVMGDYLGKTMFRGSDLSMDTAKRKADLALFADNAELCDITENLVFSDPYFEAELNHHTPGLDDLVKRLRADIDLKVAAQDMKAKFANNAETMLHGDLHTGSIMVTDTDTMVIDPEFVTYGPMGFDIGMLLANFFMAYYAQPGHAESEGARADYQEWILGVISEIWHGFCDEFSHLWRTERNGILYQASLFEDQGDNLASEQALAARLKHIFEDTLGFAGVEMIRRTLSLAHIAENDLIEDEAMRAECEGRGLRLGRSLAVNRAAFADLDNVISQARMIGQRKES